MNKPLKLLGPPWIYRGALEEPHLAARAVLPGSFRDRGDTAGGDAALAEAVTTGRRPSAGRGRAAAFVDGIS